MKLVLYFFSVLLLIIGSCKKDKLKGEYYGTASALLNGMPWQAGKVRCTVNEACFKGKVSLELHKYNTQGYLRESFGFAKFTTELGKKRVYPFNYQNACNDTLNATYDTSTDDGDVALDSYNATVSTDNYFKIECYNEDTREIWGTFSVTYVIFIRQAVNSPDTIQVTNGRFYTRILK